MNAMHHILFSQPIITIEATHLTYFKFRLSQFCAKFNRIQTHQMAALTR